MKRKNPVAFLLPVILCLVTFLTGCVGYDVGVNFNTPQSGTIVQHIKIGEQLAELSLSDAKKWLNSLEERSRQLKGNVKKLNPQEILVTIPFHNSKELAEKFNQFFHTDLPDVSAIPKEQIDLVKLDSRISLRQSNLFFVERNKLDLTIDLRALAILSNQQEKIIISPDALIDLEFQLNTPWIANSISGKGNLEPTANVANGLAWQLQPGQINHIEAVFWLPSPLGLGAGAIVLLMVTGFLLKYRRFPGIA